MNGKRRRPEYLQRLAAVRLFSDCTVKELERIDALTFEILIPTGRELVCAGETQRQCFVIASGVADVHLNGCVLTEWGPGECFGDTRDPRPAWAGVRAATPMRLYVMSPCELQTLIRDLPSVGRKIVFNLARQRRPQEENSIAVPDVSEPVAHRASRGGLEPTVSTRLSGA